jgi:hypothetical protein
MLDQKEMNSRERGEREKREREEALCEEKSGCCVNITVTAHNGLF